MPSVAIRAALPADAERIAGLIRELADFERLAAEAAPDAEALARHLDPAAPGPRCEALVAEAEGGALVGFALFFPNYSTFLTRWGLYLEDLYVQPAWRGRGVGFALLKGVAEAAVARGCRRLDWSVLGWNAGAIAFYERLGARPLSEWGGMRLSGPALAALGATASRLRSAPEA